MTKSTKIKVARAGKELGEYAIWEISERWAAGHLSMADDYWRAGMTSWGKLQDIKEEIITAKKPAETAEVTSPPPPLPAKKNSEEANGGSSLLGTIVFAIGAITLLSALTGSPDGSAIRQGVLAQHMTNGILLMILGRLISTK